MDSFNGQDTLERTGSAVYEDFYLREDRGKPAINARIALGAFIVQTLLKTTDEETVEHIEDIPYIQCFLGLGAFTTEPIIAS
ncbi:MAG TPA: transposase, partial [Thermotogota bacterium]|nr:transposase [Thermotogota bacterium]